MKHEETLKSLSLTTGDFGIKFQPRMSYLKFFTYYLDEAPIPVRYQGKSSHRYDDNPKEKLWALFFLHKNTDPAEGQNHTDKFAQLLVSGHVDKWNVPGNEVTDRDMMILASAFQWLGTPVGHQQLIELQCSLPPDDMLYIIHRLQASMK